VKGLPAGYLAEAETLGIGTTAYELITVDV
jgi:hypothetical protein